MTSNKLIDAEGRHITYLRLSVTDRCNFRCQYCTGTTHASTPTEEVLTDDDLISVVKAFVHLGIDKIRFTGGEPLLRKGIVDLAKRVSSIDSVSLIGLTTNGYLLDQKLQPLIDAGLNRLNVSLDSLNTDTFNRITGYDGLDHVLRAVEKAEQSGAFPYVKLNMVVMRGVNDREVDDFAVWAVKRKIDLRFIEYMPTQNTGWGVERFVSESEIRSRLTLDLEPEEADTDSQGPARRYVVKGYPGRISFISALSNNFCRSCSRLRVTSSGRLVGCLFREDSADMLPLLRRRAALNEMVNFIRDALTLPNFRHLPGVVGENYQPDMRKVGG